MSCYGDIRPPHLPARVGNLAAGLANCTREKSVCHFETTSGQGAGTVPRTVQADNLAHLVSVSVVASRIESVQCCGRRCRRE